MKQRASTEYYMLGFRDPGDCMLLRNLPSVGGVSWESGQRFTAPLPQPLYVDIVEGYEEDTVPPVFAPEVPMMRDDLLEAFRQSGVDNIDAYPVIISNPVTGEDIEGYSAINILGLVRAADTASTVYSPDNPSRLIDADIDSLTIDPKRVRGLLFFRLAEAVTGIVVHERVKRFVEASGDYPGLTFFHPKEWMG